MTKCLECGSDNPANSSFCENCGKPLAEPGKTGPLLNTLSGLQTIGGEPTRPRHVHATDENLKLEPGTVFADRYTIVSQIGGGGMGVVYRAKDKIGDRDVALKLIRSDRLAGESAVSKLISEGVLTQDIRHKNVVSVYHVDQCDGQPFLSMEFVNGVSLREWHRKQVQARVDVPVRVAARIIREVLDGLQAAHDMGITHRDLKPENIMLTDEPTDKAAPLKLLDFGIALAEGKHNESGTGTGLGTPRYMAPEQITNPDTAGPSADFYSLSTIFYELLVDVLPQGGWQPPSSGRPDVPAGIDALIKSGLQNRPASRPKSVAEYRDKLNAAMNNLPIPGEYQPEEPRNDKSGSPPKWLLIGGGVVGGIVVLAGLASLADEPQPYDPPVNIVGPRDDPVNPIPPVTPVSRYGVLNGQWLDDNGGVIAITMGNDGHFSGNGRTGQGMNIGIEGAFAGTGADYAVTNGTFTLRGQIAWDGRDCHLNFRTLMPDGSIADQGQFHVNHSPGAPCPT